MRMALVLLDLAPYPADVHELYGPCGTLESEIRLAGDTFNPDSLSDNNSIS